MVWGLGEGKEKRKGFFFSFEKGVFVLTDSTPYSTHTYRKIRIFTAASSNIGLTLPVSRIRTQCQITMERRLGAWVSSGIG